MSMENAIENHASAITKLAEALVTVFGGLAALAAGGGRLALENTTVADTKPAATVKGTTKKEAADNQAAVEKERADAELEKAVEKVEADTTMTQSISREEIEQAKADAAKAAAGDPDGTPLDYHKDVKPRLLAVIKRVGKPPVLELIKSFGVEKAESIDPAKFADLLTKAEAL